MYVGLKSGNYWMNLKITKSNNARDCSERLVLLFPTKDFYEVG